MKIKFLAHAAFLITTNSMVTIITDPYESGSFDGAMGYRPIITQADVITVSHSHADHSYIADHHQNALLFDKPGNFNFKDVSISGIETFHDEYFGSKRGKNIIFKITADGFSICHLGDLGHVLDKHILDRLGKIDVLLIPIGGTYTLDIKNATAVTEALAPKICIPMHYKTEKLNFDIFPIDNFINDKTNVKIISNSEIEISENILPKATEIWVLMPKKL